uniref:Uncharacterized protein n=1 Tax=Rhizophora mucronata TaxID=61149 RepID=A0A2P2P3L5_RHIMU
MLIILYKGSIRKEDAKEASRTIGDGMFSILLAPAFLRRTIWQCSKWPQNYHHPWQHYKLILPHTHNI